MERRRRSSSGMAPPPLVAAMLACAVAVMLPEVSSMRYIVGGNEGWSSNVNYTVWAQNKHFHTGDWLFFVYDRNQMNALEVNKVDYKACSSDHILHNYTTGAGRDVVPLKSTRHYYFISGRGLCFSGMKFAIKVENALPPPEASPVKKAPPPSRASQITNIKNAPSSYEDSPIKNVENAPPSTSPINNADIAPPPSNTSLVENGVVTHNIRGKSIVPTLFFIVCVWDSLFRYT